MNDRNNPYAAPEAESADSPGRSVFDAFLYVFYAVAIYGFLFVALVCFVGGMIAGLLKLITS